MNYRNYIYTKERRTFGRQCLFTNRNELLFSEPSSSEFVKEFILKNPVDRGTQLGKQMALSEMNTDNVQCFHRGMNHIEGGWPKDVNMNDEEATLRHRKKIERDDSWGQQVSGLGKRVMRSVLQNNAVNIYENYFEDLPFMDPPAEYNAHNIGIYRDPAFPTRSITHISWCPIGPDRIICTYTPRKIENKEVNWDSFVWDLEDANKPEMSLSGPAPLVSIEWNPRDEHMIAAGLETGIVAIWDPRIGSKETMTSIRETSHREAVTSLRWLHSKTNTEFFSASSDATVNFWDARILKGPVGIIIIDPERNESPERLRAHAVSVLEFEVTISTRYMVGTELGYIFIGNRKAMAPSEALLARWNVMTGPIYDLVRNPVYVKFFLVVGEWCAKICVEECKEGELIRTKGHPCELRCGTWNSGRCSLLFLGRVDGVLEFWDLIMSQEKPILEKKICPTPIWSLKTSEDGKLLIVGTDDGVVFVFELDEALTVSDRNEKNAVGALFERETRRVKLLEGRMREINLRVAAEDAKRKQREEEEANKLGEGQQDDSELAPPAEPAGESESKAAQDERRKSEVFQVGTEAHGTEEESGSEDEIANALVEIENSEKLFNSVIENEHEERNSKKCTVIKTAFDVKYDTENMMQGEGTSKIVLPEEPSTHG